MKIKYNVSGNIWDMVLNKLITLNAYIRKMAQTEIDDS